jgi:Membrane bound hydrogenase subunit mbhL
VVGPTARASGVRKDVRVDYPYCAYGDLSIDPVLPDQLMGEIRGDVYDRIVVRVLEVVQSIDIIQQCLDNMPAGKNHLGRQDRETSPGLQESERGGGGKA